MRKITTLAGSFALLAAATLPAIATGNNCENGTTGALSKNYCEIENESEVEVTNINDAQIFNYVNATANTGNNTAAKNTLGGAIVTGNSSLNTTVTNVANLNTNTIQGGPALSSNNGENNITGFDSDNRVKFENELEVEVENNNTATVYNRLDVISNTGDNNADKNTGPASIWTGDARQWTLLRTQANDNATAIQAGAGGSGGNNGANSTTGAISINYVDIENEVEVEVENINDLIVGNFVRARANTGNNTASMTTLGSEVRTGNADSGVDVATFGNINTQTVEAAMGGFPNNGSNGVTGYDSDNRVKMENELEIEVENWNNKCKSHNADRLGNHKRLGEFDLEGLLINQPKEKCDVSDLGVFNYNQDVSNTGDNNVDANTGGGVVSTGWANLWKQMVTRLNDTLTVIKE